MTDVVLSHVDKCSNRMCQSNYQQKQPNDDKSFQIRRFVQKQTYCNDSFDDDERTMSKGMNNLSDKVNLDRVDVVQKSLGDFGVALFCPLLDLQEHRSPISSPTNSRHGNDVGKCHIQTTTSLADSSRTDQTDDEERDNSSSTVTFLSTIHIRDDTENVTNNTTDEEVDDDSDNDDNDNNLYLSIRVESDDDLVHCPRILTTELMYEIQKFGMPKMLQQHQFQRCFCIGLHGDSFVTLLNQCQPYKYTLLVIRTTTGQIFGGFASESWHTSTSTTSSPKLSSPLGGSNRGSAYYGNGLSFLFVAKTKEGLDSNDYSHDGDAIDNKHSRHLSIYKWTGKNDYCQICDIRKRTLCMGGVGDFGLVVQNSLSTGRTGWSETYGNPPLVNQEYGGIFSIADFEIYGLAPLFSYSSSSVDA